MPVTIFLASPAFFALHGFFRHSILVRAGVLGAAGTAARKELRETLRDRRTIGTLVLMPLLVYPILNIAFQKFLLSSADGAGVIEYRVGMESEAKAVLLRDYLMAGERALAAKKEDGAADVPSGAPPPVEATVMFSVGPELERHVRDLDL